MEFHSYPVSFPVYSLIPVKIVIPRRQSVLPSNRIEEKTIVLFVSDLVHCSQNLVCHERNYMNLVGKLSMRLPLKTLSLSSQRKLSFIFLTLGD